MDDYMPAIVLIGIGGYGTLYVDEILKDTDNGLCALVGVVDPAAKASPRYEILTERGIPIYETPEAFFEEHTADICCIAAPIQFHTPYTLLALKYGCHVVCEKPLSTIASATEVKKVMIAITPKSAGASCRATTMLTTICTTIERSFSLKLHATPFVTLYSSLDSSIALTNDMLYC